MTRPRMPLKKKLEKIREEVWVVYNRDELRQREWDLMVPIGNILDDLDDIIINKL